MHTPMVTYLSHFQNGRTPLMYAVKSGNSKAINLLITSGAKINAVEKVSFAKFYWCD